MASYYHLYCKRANRVPYIDRISVGKNNDVDFIYQFVKHTKNENKWKDYVFTGTPTKNKNNLKWGSNYLAGTPTKFPNYGNFPEIFYIVRVFHSIIYDYPVKSNQNFMIHDFVVTFFYFSLIQRNYGTDISISPWQNEPDVEFIPQIDELKMIDSYIGM